MTKLLMMKELDESLDNSWVVIRTSIETCLKEGLAWVVELVDLKPSNS